MTASIRTHIAPHLTAQLNAAETVTTFPGPAVLASRRGAPLQANTAGEALLPYLTADPADALGKAVQTVAAGGRPQFLRQHIAEAGAGTVFDLTLLPVETASHGTAVMILGRDSSAEVGLQRALTESRQLFRDLVACSSDFAWETDANGRFRFVSPKGALGFTARDLNGRRADDLIAGPLPAGTHSPFATRLHVEACEVWLHMADGGSACMQIAALPVAGDDGRWQGARGVCRDVTEIRARERALARARERERLTQSMIDSIRSAIDPEQMLHNAAAVIGQALAASQVMIYRNDAESDGDGVAAQYLAPGEQPIVPPRSTWTTIAPDAIIDHGTIGGHHVMSASCRYEGTMRGRLCVAWPCNGELPSDVAEVINAVSAQIGIVIAKAELQDRLAQLSNTDDLTGLPNRRAFYELVARSIAHHRRHGRVGTLLYFDIDNFKSVNDTHGHQRGDEALQAVARLIADYPVRAGDTAGRIGGDEFAFWLEETGIAGARILAERLSAKAGVLADYSGAPDKPLSLSIGIAAMDPGVPEGLEDMLARADRAMYQAKRTRKGCIAIAQAPVSAPAADAAS